MNTDSERIIALEMRIAQLEERFASLEASRTIYGPVHVPNPAFPDISFSGYKITCGTAQLQNESIYK